MGDAVQVKIAASNAYGISEFSELGSGAVTQLVPYPPRYLTNDLTYTSATILKITWDDGISDGGMPIIDWKVDYEEIPGKWIELESGITGTREFISNFVVV